MISETENELFHFIFLDFSPGSELFFPKLRMVPAVTYIKQISKNMYCWESNSGHPSSYPGSHLMVLLLPRDLLYQIHKV
jgi:hypothetical protein